MVHTKLRAKVERLKRGVKVRLFAQKPSSIEGRLKVCNLLNNSQTLGTLPSKN